MNNLTQQEQELLARFTTGRVLLSRENKKLYRQLIQRKEELQTRIAAYESWINAYQERCPDIIQRNSRFDLILGAEAQSAIEEAKEALDLETRILKRALKYGYSYKSEKQVVCLLRKIELCETTLNEIKKAHPNWFFKGGNLARLKKAIDDIDHQRSLLAKTDTLDIRTLMEGYNIPEETDNDPWYHNVKCGVCGFTIYSERSLRFRVMNGEKWRKEIHGKQHQLECPRCHFTKYYCK